MIQAEKFRVETKTKLIELRKSVTQLAKELGISRPTVSIAINHSSMYPGVKKKIRKHIRL